MEENFKPLHLIFDFFIINIYTCCNKYGRGGGETCVLVFQICIIIIINVRVLKLLLQLSTGILKSCHKNNNFWLKKKGFSLK